MAFGYLAVLLGLILVVGILLQIILYTKGGRPIFLLNMIFGIILSILVFTSLPTNFIWQRVVAILWGVIAVSGLVFRLRNKDKKLISKLILTVSVVGAMVQLFI